MEYSRSLAQTWTAMLLLITCLLYCARMAMPVCAVAMATEFKWSKMETGVVMSGFFWGYCFTQILGGHASDRWIYTTSVSEDIRNCAIAA